jgi:hypothetical protein
MGRRMSNSMMFPGLLLSFTVALLPISYASSPINSTSDGPIIQGGTYYNTTDSKTTFVNTGSGDLWLQGGTTVRGLEVNCDGRLTNNGGNILLSAPGHVVRVDGTIDVKGLVNGQGTYLGNGGKVTVNSAYLFQNGNILAQGANGGHVQFNVNSVTFGPQATVDASGSTNGLGGTIHVKAAGVVDIKSGAVLNTSGIAHFDTNVIEIMGGLVNNEGLIQADGIDGNPGLDASKAAGGTIRIVARGNINLNPVADALYQSQVLTPTQANTIFNGIHDLAKSDDASIRNLGSITSNGKTLALSRQDQIDGNGGNAGRITLTAGRSILNSGFICANGGLGETAGNGGQIRFMSGHTSSNDGLIMAIGGQSFTPKAVGGQGGHIVLNNLINTGTITADGGEGDRGGDGGTIGLRYIMNQGTIQANGAVGNSQYGGLGGLGGVITATDFVNAKTGILEAKGGDGTGPNTGVGGNGGMMNLIKFSNQGTVSVDGGFGSGALRSPGGNGGRLNGNRVTNAGIISSNGGGSILQGGDGGVMIFTKLQNEGAIKANGGDGVIKPGHKTSGGHGGMVKGNQVTNSGAIQAQGGLGNTKGTDGIVVDF